MSTSSQENGLGSQSKPSEMEVGVSALGSFRLDGCELGFPPWRLGRFSCKLLLWRTGGAEMGSLLAVLRQC
jgi:hypothetical protein